MAHKGIACLLQSLIFFWKDGAGGENPSPEVLLPIFSLTETFTSALPSSMRCDSGCLSGRGPMPHPAHRQGWRSPLGRWPPHHCSQPSPSAEIWLGKTPDHVSWGQTEPPGLPFGEEGTVVHPPGEAGTVLGLQVGGSSRLQEACQAALCPVPGSP